MPIIDDNEDVSQGEWTYTIADALEEERRLRQHVVKELRPNWNDGVPIKFCLSVHIPSFSDGRVEYKGQSIFEKIELEWNGPCLLSFLEENENSLPGDNRNQRSGVYRIFVPNVAIERCCGPDRTGTLYVGRSGTGKGWSTLRRRITEVVKGAHHKMSGITVSKTSMQKFPRKSLAVQWAYTDETTLNYKGQPMNGVAAKNAEYWLLHSYNDSFGELPPWNLRFG